MRNLIYLELFGGRRVHIDYAHRPPDIFRTRCYDKKGGRKDRPRGAGSGGIESVASVTTGMSTQIESSTGVTVGVMVTTMTLKAGLRNRLGGRSHLRGRDWPGRRG